MGRPENSFIEGLEKHLPPKSPYRMKNHNVYTGGVWDKWYSGEVADLWIEYKFIVVPKRDTTIIDPCTDRDMLSKLQQDWGRERYAEKRNIAVIIGCKEGGVWLPGLTWDRPFTAAEFRAKIVSRAELAAIIHKATNGREIHGAGGSVRTEPARERPRTNTQPTGPTTRKLRRRV